MNYSEYKNIKINGGFLAQKQALNRSKSIDAVWNRFYESGRIEAMSCSYADSDDEIRKPHVYWDSDVAKWVEGASYIYGKTGDSKLMTKIESVIDRIETNIRPDGYYNSYYLSIEPSKRFTDRNNHELYCLGHLIEAAVAYYEASGKDRFLNLIKKYADLVYRVFLEEESTPFTTPGHEEIELALIRLYDVCGEEKYLNLAKFFIEKRGNNEKDGHTPTYQDFPVRKQTEANGHSVRLLYLYTAVSALALRTDDEELKQRCRNMFENITQKKMYITGGVGSTYIGECFTKAYDLPNKGAYGETCAAISMAYFCKNMLEIEKNSKYADIMEKVVYNAILSGLSLNGKAFFYENPLEINLDVVNRLFDVPYEEHKPKTRRQELFTCSCCPPNLNRFLEEYESLLYDVEGNSAYIHLFADSTYDKNGVHIECHTDYPNDGKLKIAATGINKLYVRIPGWCDGFSADKPYTSEHGYALFENTDEVNIDMPMKPKLIASNINVHNNIGKAALTCGPLVYCAESNDNIKNLHSLYINKNLNANINYDEFFGANTIETDGYIRIHNSDKLYSEYSEEYENTRIKFIPYFGFANRDESNMIVYMKVK